MRCDMQEVNSGSLRTFSFIKIASPIKGLLEILKM